MAIDYVQIGGVVHEIVPEIAPLFDELTNYSVGDCVIHEAKLYRFINNHVGAWTGTDAEEFKIAETLEHKADVDGVHPDMTVGNADQLTSSVVETDTEPYNFRTAGGTLEIGNRQYVKKLVGGSVVWNQYCTDPAFTDESKWWHSNTMSVTLNNHVAECIASAKYANMQNAGIRHASPAGHVICMVCDLKADESYSIEVIFGDNVLFTDNFTKSIGTSWATYGCFSKHNAVTMTTVYCGIRDANESDWKKVYVRNFCVFDLTLMFGPTIADYIYSLETATPGSGIAWLRHNGYFTKKYYPYCAPSMEHTVTDGHKMTGFNQWDEELETGGIDDTTGANASSSAQKRSKNYISALPNTVYYANVPGVGTGGFWVYCYNADKNFIDRATVTGGSGYDVKNNTFTTPEGTRYIRFKTQCTVNYDDISINLHWDGERDGEYEAYKEYEYPIEPVELRGIPKLDANNHLYYDGDEYMPDGTVTRRYAEIDLGDCTYTRTQSGLFETTYIRDTVRKPSSTSYATGWLKSAIYDEMGSTPITGPDGADPSPNMRMAVNSLGGLYFNNTSYTDAATFKTAMAGQKLVFELATPTTESAEPYQSTQNCDNWGTEQYSDYAYTQGDRDFELPIGHETDYPVDMKAKLESTANNPSEDGVYLLHYANGEASYTPLASDSVITNILERLTALEG